MSGLRGWGPGKCGCEARETTPTVNAGTRFGGVRKRQRPVARGPTSGCYERKGLSRRHGLLLTAGKTQTSTSGADLGPELLSACVVLRPSLIASTSRSHSRGNTVEAAKTFHTAIASVHRLGHELRDVPFTTSRGRRPNIMTARHQRGLH